MNNRQMWMEIAKGYRNPLPERQTRYLDDNVPLPTYDEAQAPLPLGAERLQSPAEVVLTAKSIKTAADHLGAIGGSLNEIVNNLREQTQSKLKQIEDAKQIAASALEDGKQAVDNVKEGVADKTDEGVAGRVNAGTALDKIEQGVFSAVDNLTGGKVDGEDLKLSLIHI